MVFRLLRTIFYVIANPDRSLAWKVLDSLFLLALLLLVLGVLLTPSADDLGYYFLLLPVVVLVTCRSWYSMPRRHRHMAPAPEEHSPRGPAEPGPGDDARAWDPIGDDQSAALSPALGDDRPQGPS